MQLTSAIIKGFSSSLLQKNFDNAVESPKCHEEWWELCCSSSPKVAISAPRRHAKSTAITLAYVLACVCFRERSYVLVVSDTITQATQFLSDVKKELSDNENLRELFQIKGFEKDTEDDCIVRCVDGHEFRLSAKGSEQKLRGLKWNNKRPDLIVGDDLENDEIVLNSERREKFKRWFYGALLPCLSVKGIVRIVGTILHEDSLLNNLMPSEWGKHTVVEPLKMWSKDKKAPWQSVKYKAHTDDFKHILWPANYTAEYFLSIRADYYARGIPDVYSQEYLNEPIDESVAFFKKGDFLASSETERKQKMHTYITCDLAISKSETSDYSVFLVAGVDENKNIHVKNILRERLDGREIVDTLISLQKIYEPELVGIEEMQVSKAIGPFLREEMLRTGVYLNLLPLKHGGKDKIARARSIQARIKARTVKFDKSADWYHPLEDELTKFPRAKHDDQVDCLSYLGLMLDSLIEAPTQKEMDNEQYESELRESGLYEHGRSEYTGY